jgi:2-polyprenyl-3-methyl-5-hydroxy-6-metoxy-1,4-benzoquinol methylase
MSTVEQKEAAFHDQWAEETSLDEIYLKEAFESLSSPENKQILEWMGPLKGKKILELGCGLGEASAYFATQGAKVLASDISEKMVQNAKRLAHHYGAEIDGVVVSANHLDNIENETFDFIYAGNLLHHVDIAMCINNLKPKLKQGGTAFFWDPIAYNPAINIYRRIATKVRTEDEHPLTRRDIKLIQNEFSVVETKFFWFTSLVVFFWFYFIQRVDPNKERYWKKILKDAKKIEPILSVTHKVDQFIFFIIPPLRMLAWNIVIRAKR